MGLRIMERVKAEYGDEGDAELDNPFQRRRTTQGAETPKVAEYEATKHEYEEEDHHRHEDADADLGGGFLLPGHDDPEADLGGGFLLPGQYDDTNDFVVEHGDDVRGQTVKESMDVDEDEPDPDEPDELSGDVEMSSPSEGEEEYKPPPRSSNRRRRRGG